MATAETEVSQKLVFTTENVTLNMSLDEAHALMAIVGKIGGDPDLSARKHMDAIAEALRTVNLHWDESKYNDYVSGGIHFSDHKHP